MQTLLNFPSTAGKTAKPEQFIDNSFVAELEKSGFIKTYTNNKCVCFGMRRRSLNASNLEL